jgi:hypothetical protein
VPAVNLDLLGMASFWLDQALAPDRRPTAVGASVDHAVHLPDELAAYFNRPS